MNKYEKWYNAIIEKAKNNKPGPGIEGHHIIPESFFIHRSRKGPPGWLEGNPETPLNLVQLPTREHFICHWLLVKMHTGRARAKMINALYMMRAQGPYQDRYQTKITSRVYAKIRAEFSEHISSVNTGRIQPLNEKAKQIAAITGRKRAPFSKEWRANLSAAKSGENNNRYGVKFSDETRKKISDKAKNRKYSAETIEKRASKIRGSKRARVICPHCGKDASVNTYPRWHGDNCKQLKKGLT